MNTNLILTTTFIHSLNLICKLSHKLIYTLIHNINYI